MSLEDAVTKNTLTMEALTDAVQQLCAIIRQAPPSIGQGAVGENPTKPRKGRPAGADRVFASTNPPPSPMDLAADSPASNETPSITLPDDAGPITSTTATPGSAPDAASGSDPQPTSPTPAGDYATLKALVLDVGEKHGRTVVAEILAKLGGYKSALEIKENPEKIAEAIPLFQSALEMQA